MKVTVIIPVYNGERYVREAILSALDGAGPMDVSVMVIDDGSTDQTPKQLQMFADDKRVTVYRRANEGVSSARNYGLTHLPAGTEYVTFLDSDDVVEPNVYQHLADVLEGRPELAAAGGLCRAIDSVGTVLHAIDCKDQFDGRAIRRCSTVGEHDERAFCVENVISTPGQLLIRADAVRSVGRFDSQLRRSEDWDYFIRLARVGKIQIDDLFVLRYRTWPGQATSGLRKMQISGLRVRLKWILSDSDIRIRGTVLLCYVLKLANMARWKRRR